MLYLKCTFNAVVAGSIPARLTKIAKGFLTVCNGVRHRGLGRGSRAGRSSGIPESRYLLAEAAPGALDSKSAMNARASRMASSVKPIWPRSV